MKSFVLISCLDLKMGAVSNVKGSAYMEYGNTKVMAHVEPPREITKQSNRW